jgi:DNA polymerase-3 subunit beta
MSLTFLAGELRKALAACRGVVETHSTIPVLSCIVIRTVDGQTYAEATDLDLYLRWPVAATGSGCFVVPFAPLSKIVRHLGDGEMIRIGAAPDNRVRIDMADARASFLSLPIADWPDSGWHIGGAPRNLTMPPSSLADLIPFISTEETRYYLNGVCIDVGIETACTVATNGHTMGLITSAADRVDDGDCGRFIVPRRAVNWIAAHAKGINALDVGLTAAKAQFKTAGFELTCKLIDGTYPEYSRVVPIADTPTLLEIDAGAFNRKLARLEAFGKRYCGLSYDGVRLVGSSSGMDGELISIAFGGKAYRRFDLQFQSFLLMQGLAFVGGQVIVRSSGIEHPLRIDGNGSRISVVMPARAGTLKHDLPQDIAA